MTDIEQAWAEFRAGLVLPEINHWSWPGGPIKLAGEDAGCFLFRHERGYKRPQVRQFRPRGRSSKYGLTLANLQATN